MRRHDVRATIVKICLSNFLVGLVFWYGIEKLFMLHVGITAADIGILTALVTLVPLLFDIPAGLLADRWSRKGTLILAALLLGGAGVVEVTSHSLWQFCLGYVLYGLYLVCTSGTYQALMYDVLHEAGRAAEYSKMQGRAYGIFLAGAGVANIASGFLAHVSLALPYWLTLGSCALNVVVLLSIREPKFHKQERKERFLAQIGVAVKSLLQHNLLRSLIGVAAGMGVAEVFKQDFSQLYMLQFTSSTIVLGLLWAGYAFAWATGYFIAHYMRRYLNALIIVSFGCLIALGLVRAPWGLAIFMLQAVVSAAAYNLIETRIQNETPSWIRASVLSATTTLYRIINLPMSLVYGWLISTYTVFAAWQLIAVISAAALMYWLLVGRKHLGIVDQEPVSD